MIEKLSPDEAGRFPAIARNLEAGKLRALALTASSYTTGLSVTWVQDIEGCWVLTSDHPERQRPQRCLVRGLGSRETRSNDMLSLLMFQADYVARVMELGEADARARSGEIEAFLRRKPSDDGHRPSTLARYLAMIKRRVLR